jgi:hypothetical protein
MEAPDAPGRGDVDRLSGTELPRRQSRVGELLRSVLGIDEARDDGHAGDDGRGSTRHVRLEQRGMDQVRASLGDEPAGSPDPTDPTAGTVEAHELGAGGCEPVLEAGSVVQVRDLEAYTRAHESGSQIDERSLCPACHEAVDHVENVESAYLRHGSIEHAVRIVAPSGR